MLAQSSPNTTLYYKASKRYLLILLQSLQKSLPILLCITKKACTRHFPILFYTTKFTQSTFRYYFVLQSLYKEFPNTILYHKACAINFLVLRCTTKLAQSTPSTTLYYKACIRHFPILFVKQSLHKAFPALLCTTKLAQEISQYYFVLQCVSKALPGTTLY